MRSSVLLLVKFCCTSVFILGLAACAVPGKAAKTTPADLQQAREQFASGRHARSLEICSDIIAGRADCPPRDQALYYAALNSMRLERGPVGRARASAYFKALLADCPASPCRPEAELWLQVLSGTEPGMQGGGPSEKQELERLRRENARLARELDLLKNVDMQLHRQKKDLNDGSGKGKNTRP